MRTRTARAEAELLELKDLLCAAVLEKHAAAAEWLVAIAEGHQPAYAQRRQQALDEATDVLIRQGMSYGGTTDAADPLDPMDAEGLPP